MAAPIKLTRPAGGAWPSAGHKPAPASGSETSRPAGASSRELAPSTAVIELRRRRRNGDVLGIVWTHGAMQVASFRRQTVVQQWEAAGEVRSFAEFAAALDEAIVALKYVGTEVFLILAHDEFVHQAENAPPFADKAARAYLEGRVERMQQEREPLLWVCQRAATVKREGNFILHLLPLSFYHRLNDILLQRRLDLARILPLHVPLHLVLSSLTETRDMPMLVATEAGSSTAVLVGKTGSDVLFGRTILESWRKDAARVAVEINRSLLYAKQQFGANVDFLWLLGRGADEAQAEVIAKCGTGTDVVVEETGPLDWLKAAVRLPARHPVNLVGSFLRSKRRGRFVRRLVMAACWLVLALLGFDAWNEGQAWRVERNHLMTLRAEEETLRAERDRLTRRNSQLDRDRALVRDVVGERMPPVAAKFLAYVATVLPREASLTGFEVKWNQEAAAWEFRLSGTLQADPEAAATMSAAVRRQFATGPFRARILDTVRGPTALVVGGGSTSQPFTLEGTLFED